jgi:hypothetical protein
LGKADTPDEAFQKAIEVTGTAICAKKQGKGVGKSKTVNRLRIAGLTLVALSAALFSGCSNDSADDGEQSVKEAEKVDPEKIADIFLAGEYERLYNQTSKDFQKEVSLKQLQQIGDEFNQEVDTYTIQSEMPLEPGITQLTWIDDGNAKGVVAVVDDRDTVLGFRALPLQTYPETDDDFTESTFVPPFHDAWFVVWGGTNSLVNYHYEYDNQRYAYDFLIMEGDSSFKGDPAKNDSYYACGKEVIAPADGQVVQIENDVPDNEPVGKMNEEQFAGNYVIIDHGNDEYSLLAHFKHQSIKVQEGDWLKQGDVLGLTGNSGNSSEPHIHFHVADAPDLGDSKSIRIKFEDGQNWVQGDYVQGE